LTSPLNRLRMKKSYINLKEHFQIFSSHSKIYRTTIQYQEKYCSFLTLANINLYFQMLLFYLTTFSAKCWFENSIGAKKSLKFIVYEIYEKSRKSFHKSHAGRLCLVTSRDIKVAAEDSVHLKTCTIIFMIWKTKHRLRRHLL